MATFSPYVPPHINRQPRQPRPTSPRRSLHHYRPTSPNMPHCPEPYIVMRPPSPKRHPSDLSSDSSTSSTSPPPTPLTPDAVLHARLRALKHATVTPVARRLKPPHPASQIPRPTSAPPPSYYARLSLDLPTISPISSLYDSSSPRTSATSRSSLSSSTKSSLSSVPSPTGPAPIPTRLRQDSPPRLAASPSAGSLALPKGRVEHLHMPRPATQVRLPRPRVFIKQNSLRASSPPAIPQLPTSLSSSFLPRDRNEPSQSSRRSAPISPTSHLDVVPHEKVTTLMDDDDFFFSDDDGISDDETNLALNGPIAHRPIVQPMQSDLLASKVKRAISTLRSISFQAPAVEDLDTAWGQASNPTREHMAQRRRMGQQGVISSRWRRPRGRISSKNGVQEYECYSEADAGSVRSSSSRYGKPFGGREAVRGGVPAMHAARMQKKSLWTGRRDRNSPQMAAHILVGGNGRGCYLAAATGEMDRGVTALVPADTEDGPTSRRSVDKYVEFIHASAQRESRGKVFSKHLPGRVINRAQAVFRRKWR